ncbi:MAG: YitT family protein, partial [Bacteroidales bacterium]|nr:YitT family protein [Bacteroidales bacterium]
MPDKEKNLLHHVKEYALLVLGLLLYVLGWTVFLVPNNLVGGGVTGVASIIQYATHGVIKIGYT